MAKKIFENPQSKLAARAAGSKESGDHLGLIAKRPPKLHPKSFRLKTSDLERLSAIVAKMKKQYPDKAFGETDVVRGLFVIGGKISPERLISAIRDAIL